VDAKCEGDRNRIRMNACALADLDYGSILLQMHSPQRRIRNNINISHIAACETRENAMMKNIAMGAQVAEVCSIYGVSLEPVVLDDGAT
jgi:hypothetical protein